MNKKLSPKKGVRFISDIIEEVSNETPFTSREVKEAWTIHKKYLKKLMENPDVISIRLPHIGILYFNANTARAIVKWSKTKTRNKLVDITDKEKKVRIKVKKHKKESEDRGLITISKYPQVRLGGMYRLYLRVSYIISKKVRTSYGSVTRIRRILEDYSNNQ